MRILIVDDKEENRYLLETLLNGSGYEAETAANGVEALEKLRAKDFDLIIADILMPVMDGFHLCREVKADDELKHTLFVFYTATYTDERDEDLAFNMGAEKFIRKPMEPEEFVKIIRDLLHEVKAGEIEARQPVLEMDEEIFKLYSERLVRKLESKMLDLEKEVAERKRVEEALKQSEERHRTLFEQAADGIIVADAQCNLLDVNTSGCRMLGYSREEVLQLNLMDLVTEGGLDSTRLGLKDIGSGESIISERQLICKDGSLLPVEIGAKRLPDGRLQGIIRDITKRKLAEKALQKINRALTIISKCNQVVVRATTEGELLKEICQIIVEVGEYRLAWVGFAEHDKKKSIRPVAHKGYEEGYLETLNVSWADTKRGSGPTGTAIRTAQAIITRDIQNDPAFAPWRSEALKRDYASSIALPLKADGQSLGALNIYASEPDAFDKEEAKLLEELADDLAYGITALRTQAERDKAEQALREAYKEYEKLERIVNASPAVVFRWSAAEGWPVEFVSDNVEQFGYTPEDFYDRHLLFEKIIHPDDLDRVSAEVIRFSQERCQDFGQEYRIIT